MALFGLSAEFGGMGCTESLTALQGIHHCLWVHLELLVKKQIPGPCPQLLNLQAQSLGICLE